MRWVGRPLPRYEDPILLQGRGRYTADAFTDLERDGDGFARVALRDPDHGTEVSLWVDESYPYLMLFTGDPLPDVRRRSLAVEPHDLSTERISDGDALIRLEPGCSFTSTWGIARPVQGRARSCVSK